jgi:putative membrane protein
MPDRREGVGGGRPSPAAGRAAMAQAARGVCMGAADVVPGVSGGTVALVLGIYERLIATIGHAAGAAGRLLRGDARGSRTALGRIDWGFIVPLLAGIAAAFVTLARAIEHLLAEHPISLSALFFGLVAASAVVAHGHIRRPARLHLAIALGSGAITFALLGFGSGAVEEATLLRVFGSGALAICAMILPGISGSFILLMIGMYDLMIGALNDRDLPVIVVFILGCAVGLGLFARLLARLLRTHHDVLMAALIGLMLGSLRVLWPWPEGTESAALGPPPADGWPAPALIALAGAAVVLVLARIARPRAPAAGADGA